MTSPPLDLRSARRRLLADIGGLAASAFAFGIVYGLAARTAGFSTVDAVATSLLVFAGASQFAAVGLLAAGAAWPLVIVTTFLLNLRHLLYAAALRPSVASRSLAERAGMAHVLTDEAFALSTVHFRRVGWPDTAGYWLAAIGAAFIPWNAGTIVGVVGGAVVPDPTTLGLDVVFPAAMAGISVALIGGRRELVAVAAGIAVTIAVGVLADPRLAIVAGGLVGPLAGMAVPVATGSSDDAPPPIEPLP